MNTVTMNTTMFLIATEELYCESYGAYDVLHVCDADGDMDFITLRGNDSAPKLEKASDELKAKAAASYVDNKLDTNAKRGHIGCTVVLARSRKAPNATPLKVVDFVEAHYDNRYNQRVDAKVAVDVEGQKMWVNKSCIKDIIKGKAPYWA